MHDRGHPDEPFQPIALLLAAILPGAGHFYLGFRARAGLIAAGVLGLFTLGMFVGGADTVDRREDTIWFVGQAMVGPIAFAADSVNQSRLKGYPTDQRTGQLGVPRTPAPGQSIVGQRDPRTGATIPLIQDGGRPRADKSIGRANELGLLFTALAGMVNLICVLDAGWSRTKREWLEDERAAAAVDAAMRRGGVGETGAGMVTP